MALGRTPLTNSQFLKNYRYSYKVVEEAPVAEESRTVIGRPVANEIQAEVVKEVEEEIAAIESNDPAQAVEASAPVEEVEEEPVTTIPTPASYYYRFY